MEKVKIMRNSTKYDFKVGDEFIVKRNIMNECVIIVNNENKPNIILSESELKYYGNLIGEPQLCFN